MATLADSGYAIPDYDPYRQFSDIQHFTFLDKYANYLPNEGRRETWVEAVTRSVDSLRMLSNNRLSFNVYQSIFDAIYQMEVLPSMRLFSMPQTAIERDNSVIYNCAFRGIDSTQAMAEMLYLGMSGCGTGFSVEKRFIKKLPVVQFNDPYHFYFVTIPDTQVGWASTYKFFLDALFDGGDVAFNYEQIRPAGARLKTKGGYSSGPGVLKELHDHVRTIIKGAQGRRLTSVEVLDIVNYITQAAISGGSRRAAQIALGDPDDNQFISAKTNIGNKFWRYNSNNSAVWDDETSEAVKKDLLHELYVSGAEPGIFNRDAAIKGSPTRRIYSYPELIGTNPCQPGFATVLTPQGIRTFDNISVGSVIWSGKDWTKITRKVSTGIKIVNAYKTSAGVFIGTENHRIVENDSKVEVGEATSIDACSGMVFDYSPYLNPQDVMDGLLIGDGTVHKASNDLVLLIVGEKDREYFQSEVKELIGRHRPGVKQGYYEVETTVDSSELPYTYEREVPARFYYGEAKEKIGFLRGLFSANGFVTAQNRRIGLKQSSYKLIRQVQEMLSSLGISSYITTTKEIAIKHENGTYVSKQNYAINITRDRYRFVELIGFIQEYKNRILGEIGNHCKTSYEIYEVECLGEFPVYDITVEATEHTYWSGGLLVSNCGEVAIAARPDGGEFCNLSTAIITATDTIPQINQKIEIAAIIGTIQSMATNFPFLEKGWKINQEQDRLLGVCITGITDNAYLRKSHYLQQFKQTAVTTNVVYAKKLGIERSVAVTAVKPSGNTSALADTSPGINPRHYAYAKRNILVNVNTAMYEFLVANEVPFFDSPSRVTDKIFVFPYASPKGVILQKDMDALQQCNLWQTVKSNYTEHNVSVSIQYQPEEFSGLESWILDHSNEINGMAFFKNQNEKFVYLPIQEISKEEHQSFVKSYPVLHWNYFGLYEQARDEKHEATECSGGSCTIMM